MAKNISRKAGSLTLGSAMLLMSMIPAASAFAATAPAVVSVTLSSEQGTVAVGNTVSFTATAVQSGTGTPLYQFWYEGVNGNWHSTSWSTSNSFSLPPLKQGSYEVVVYAKDKGQAIPANSEGTNSNQFVNVDSSATLTAPTLTNVAPGTTLTFTASSKNLTEPVYQLWIQSPDGNWFASGDYQSSPTFQITAELAGDYHAVLYAKDLNAPQTAAFSKYAKATFDAFGQAAAIKLAPSSSAMVADGSATDTITATVVDANGNPVADFNGTASVLVNLNGDSTTGTTPTSVTFTNGVGTFTVPSVSGSASSATFTVSDLTSTNGQTVAENFPVASGMVTLSQPTASALAVTSQLPDLSVNSQTPDNITVQLLDQAGNPIAGSQLVTLTLSGEGSFAASSAQTSTTVLTSSTNGSVVVPIYDEQGMPGTITVSAAGSGLTGASVSVPTYETTAPNSVDVMGTSATLSATLTGTVSGTTVSFPSGTAYTVYTADLEDQYGHLITTGAPSSGSLTISDNTATTGGNLVYYSLNSNGQPYQQIGTSSAAISEALANGQYQFAVFNTATGSANATITVDDTSASLSGTTTYEFSAGPAAQVAVTSSANATVSGGTTRTFTYQLEDANGNKVTTAGEPVYFYFDQNSAGATLPNGASPSAAVSADTSGFTAPNGAYLVDTNSQGQASVTVSVPSSTTSGTYELAANLSGGVDASGLGPVITVSTPSNIVTSVGLVSGSGTLSGTLTAGATPTATIGLYNAVDALASGTTDEVQITTSNDNVVSLASVSGSAWTLSSSGDSATAYVSSGTVAVPSGLITADKVGTATLTISDVSNPSVPSLTETVTVQAGTYSKMIAVSPSAATSGTLTISSSGVYGPYTIEATDSEGNVLPAPEAITLTSAQVEAMVSASSGVTFNGIRTTTGGVDVANVTIPAGGTSVQVYLDTALASGQTSGTITAYAPTASGATEFSAVVPEVSSASVSTATTSSNGSVTVTFSQPITAGTSAYIVVASGSTNYDLSISAAVTSANTSAATFTIPSADAAVSTSWDISAVSGVNDANGNGAVVPTDVSL